MVLDQLTRTLRAESKDDLKTGLAISGAGCNCCEENAEMGVSAAAHGFGLSVLDDTVDQVVLDHIDLCQAISDLAVDLDAQFQCMSAAC